MKATNCANPTCRKPLKHTKGRRPKKYCNDSCRNGHYKVLFPAKKKIPVTGTIELPKDFIGFDKVAIVRADGTIEELKTASQLPQSVYMSMMAMRELQNDVNPQSKTSSGLVVEFHQTDSKTKSAPIEEKSTHGLPDERKAQIEAYEKELATVPDMGAGKQRRKWLQNKINDLKQQLI